MALPPGRARLSTKPAPTGSGTIVNTIGTVRVACSIGMSPALPVVSRTSGASATSSRAYLASELGVASGELALDLQIAAHGPTQLP